MQTLFSCLFMHHASVSYRLKWIDDQVVKFQICYHQWRFSGKRQKLHTYTHEKKQPWLKCQRQSYSRISLVDRNIIFNIFLKFSILLLFQSIFYKDERDAAKQTWEKKYNLNITNTEMMRIFFPIQTCTHIIFHIMNTVYFEI